MKKGTTICVVAMVASFVLSLTFLFVSAGLFVISGTKELADRIREGRWDDIADKIEFVKVDKEDGVRVDLPGVHVIVDDKGVDVSVIGIHVDTRDDDEETENKDANVTDPQKDA
ncbi:MAG: hypothetical protein J6T40_07075 [Clostridiales bacterium]|nr:hypothetical protein [Clostridiales bacterium]MBR5937165.1 hypothetical protein [Clostridiales bacterium]